MTAHTPTHAPLHSSARWRDQSHPHSPLRALVHKQVSMLNYIDRGIIAGAGTTIKGCMPNGDSCSREEAVPCPGKNESVPWNCTSHCLVCGAICNGKEVRVPNALVLLFACHV